jgi:hypothetical protein
VPAGRLIGKGVVQSVAQHTVVELTGPHAIAQRPRATR